MAIYKNNSPIVTDGLQVFIDTLNPKSIDYYNLLEKTENFNTSPWIKLGSPNVTVVENNALAPNGTTTASRMTSNSNSSFGLRQTVSLKINKLKRYTFSVWVRSDDNAQIVIDISDAASQTFDVTSTWTRVSITSTGYALYSDTLQFVDIVFSANQSGKNVFLWGAQLVEGEQMLDYQYKNTAYILNLQNRVRCPITSLYTNYKSINGNGGTIQIPNNLEFPSWSLSFWTKYNLSPTNLSAVTLFRNTPPGGTSVEGSLSVSDTVFYNINSLEYLNDGKILLGGQFAGYDGTVRDTIVKIKSNGQIDTDFTGYEISNANILQITKIQQISNGDVYLAGTNIAVGGIRVINSSSGALTGTQLSGVAAAGGAGPSICTSFIIDEPNNFLYVLGGWWNTYQSTNVSGKIVKMALDTKVVTAGFDASTGFRLTSGSIDTSGANGVTSGILLSDNNLLILGSFQEYKQTSANRIVKINSTNASIDTSFNYGVGFNNATNAAVQQTDGKIIVAGAFTTYSGSSANRIVRLNTNGTIDSSFVTGSGFNNPVNTLLLQSDGKIVAGGDFTSYSGSTANRIVRLNTDGTIDTEFQSLMGTGFNSSVNLIKDTGDKLIIIGQATTTFGGLFTPTSISRLNKTTPVNLYGGQSGSSNLIRSASGIVSAFYPIANGSYNSIGNPGRNIEVSEGQLSPFDTRCSKLKNSTSNNGGFYLMHNTNAALSQNAKYIHCAVVKPITDCRVIIGRASGLSPAAIFNFNTQQITFNPNSTSTTVTNECFMEEIGNGFWYIQFTYLNSESNTFDEHTLIVEPNAARNAEIDLAYVGAFRNTTITRYQDAILTGVSDETFYSFGVNLPRYRGQIDFRLAGNVSQTSFNGPFGISSAGNRWVFNALDSTGRGGGSFLWNNFNNCVITFGSDRNFRFYRNGFLYDTIPSTSGAAMTLKLNDLIFRDEVYNISVYNKVLSESEILQNYNNLRTRYNIN